MICFKSWGFQAPFSDREIRWLSSFGADWIIEFHLDDSWWVNAYFPPCFTHLELVKPFRSSHFFMVKNQRRPKNRAALARAQPLPYICWTKLHGFLPEKRATSTASIIQVARPQLQGPRRADTRQPQAWWRFPSFWVMECHGNIPTPVVYPDANHAPGIFTNITGSFQHHGSHLGIKSVHVYIKVLDSDE